MPKLIIKQDIDPARRQAQRNKRLSVFGLLVLFTAVAVAAFLLTRPVINSPAQEPLKLGSATSMTAKNSYLSLFNVFNELSAEYETLSARGSDDYEKNLKLLGKSDAILSHLEKMRQIVPEIGLGDDEHKQLLNRQQFYKDYWQAKSHFRQLRVSRFENTANAEDIVVPEQQTSEQAITTAAEGVAETEIVPVTDTVQPKKFKFATPPPGMELPAGFCDLTNPDSCKLDNTQMIDAPAGINAPLAADLAAPDDIVPVADNAPKKFKFAAPPPGMELPEGFCDLSKPGSCKPGTAEVGMSTEQNNQAN